MKRAAESFLCLVVLALSFFTASPVTVHADASNKTIASRNAETDGVKLHYLTAGSGPSLILLHGYAETSLMWKPIMPALAADGHSRRIAATSCGWSVFEPLPCWTPPMGVEPGSTMRRFCPMLAICFFTELAAP